jgi:hypothetical protein
MSTTNSKSPRNSMAVGEEPTDEELSLVMREALALALSRQDQSMILMKQKLIDTVIETKARDQRRKNEHA